MLLLDEGHCLRGHALQICQMNVAEEEQNVRATGLETLRQMVRAGTGITFMPRIAIRENDDEFVISLFKDKSQVVRSAWFGAKPVRAVSWL